MIQKKNMTSLDIKAWLSENSSLLENARVNNVYHFPNTKLIVFKLYGAGDYKYLIIEPEVRLNLSKYVLKTPDTPDTLAMALRKHLRGRKIKNVSQVGFDRLLEIIFSNEKKLYVELLPRGEAVLVDENDVILQATGFKEMKDRILKRGKKYALPPYFEREPTFENCLRIAEEKNVFSLTREMGIPKEVVLEAIRRSGSEEPGEVCKMIIEIIKESQDPKGYIIVEKKNGKMISFYPYKPTLLNDDYDLKIYDRFNDAIDDFFVSKEILSEEKMGGKTKSKLEKTLEKTLKSIEEYREKSIQYRKQAELMNTYRSLLEKALACARRVREEKTWMDIPNECENISKVHPSQGLLSVEIDGNEILLSIRKDVWEQINERYELAKKYKKKADVAQQYTAKLYEKIEKEEKEKELSITKKKSMYRKKEWYEKFRWSFTRNGLLVIAGKDASQNESIVKKYMEPNDVFLHADIHGAPVTVLKTEGKKFNDDDIYDAAVIAASYSKAWKNGLKNLDVFWVRPSQVSKSPPPGEYLPKGSFMIYGKKNYVKKVPLELTIGVQELPEGAARFIIGSFFAVEKNGVPLLSLEPGDLGLEKIVKRIKKIIEKKRIENVPDYRELTNLLPAPSRIKKVFGD